MWPTRWRWGEWYWPNRQERKEVRFAPRTGRYVVWRRVEGWGWYTRQDGRNYPGFANANEVWVYPPAPAALVPVDTDADGLADWIEDINGNGMNDGSETHLEMVDTDYDGRTDLQELAEDTDPVNVYSARPARLGWWRFNAANWAGEQGQLPRQAVGVQRPASWSGTALEVPYSGPANLKYHDQEPGGAANIICRQGTVRFWFRPNWSSGSGPWTWGRLIELGSYTQDGSYGFWSVFLNPEGNLLQFHTQGGGAGALAAASVNWTAGTWHQVTVTYGPAASAIYVDGVRAATGTGVTHYPSATVRLATGLNVGSDSTGGQRVNGQIEELETFNYELDSATIEAEYSAMLTPSGNLDVSWSGLRVNTPLVTGAVLGRPTAQMAVRVYLTDVAAPDFTGLWGLFYPSFQVHLGSGDGPRYLWVGFRGMDAQGQPGPEVWRRYEVVLDTTPPVLTITEPVGTTMSQPVIQVRGSANEGLRGVTYNLANALGTLQDQRGLIMEHTYDVTMHTLTEGRFQVFDLKLAPGANMITLRATDLAGNTTVLPLPLTLDLTGDSTPPAITLHWPVDGTEVAADTFDLRGQVDDACATVSVSGLTDEPVEGLVERNGVFWVEGLPLPPGSHTLTVTATDAAGNVTTQALTVTRSPVTLTITEPTEAELAQAPPHRHGHDQRGRVRGVGQRNSCGRRRPGARRFGGLCVDRLRGSLDGDGSCPDSSLRHSAHVQRRQRHRI